ncbi:MAG TPA: MbtH family NRPS accessory protein [Terriglobales bacterium]|jgi:uncharacterized protein YbdZ (MbtH family)
MSWNDPEKDDSSVYKVVINHEEQYSILLNGHEIPSGWKHVGKTGTKAECLDYIKEAWTDMRPLSLRKKMEELAMNPRATAPLPERSEQRGRRLVDLLCEGSHAVEVALRPVSTVKLFKEAIDRDYVCIKFTQTKGGTELGFRLDEDACDLSKANFESGKGPVHIEGNLTLDYVKIKCVADIDLSTLAGTGHLVKVEANNERV